jgi:hypothetical protein
VTQNSKSHKRRGEERKCDEMRSYEMIGDEIRNGEEMNEWIRRYR